MSKRKLILSLFIFAIVAGAGIWAASAYFVASERTHNIITSAGVSIDLIETTESFDENGEPVLFENIKNALPGETYSKIPQVKNTDSGAAWVRVKIEKTVKLSDGTFADFSESALFLDLNLENWEENDGYLYYKTALNPSETTEPLFTKVRLSPELKNEYEDATFSLDLIAEAVQVANNGSTAIEAKGWTEE